MKIKMVYFDDGDDLCLGTPIGTEVDVSGCPVYRFANDNFNVSLQSEACRESNDGAINISTLETLNYEITIGGNGVNINDDFTDTYTLSNLMAGTYNVCIGGTDGKWTMRNIALKWSLPNPMPCS